MVHVYQMVPWEEQKEIHASSGSLVEALSHPALALAGDMANTRQFSRLADRCLFSPTFVCCEQISINCVIKVIICIEYMLIEPKWLGLKFGIRIAKSGNVFSS